MTNGKSKILISAAGGKVGQHVLTQLAQKNISARAGVHSEEKAAALRKSGGEAVALDFESPASISAAFEGIEKLFLVTPGSPDQGRQEENLLAEAEKVGVKHIVKMSGKISESDTVGFSVWNRAAEKRITENGISYTILRGNYFMQNLFGNAAQIKQGAFTAGPAAKRIALIDTRDIAATAVAALAEEGHAGKIYDLNGPELLDGHAQAAAFSKVLGRTVKYLDVSAEAFIGQLKNFGLPPWMVEAFGVAVALPKFPVTSRAPMSSGSCTGNRARSNNSSRTTEALSRVNFYDNNTYRPAQATRDRHKRSRYDARRAFRLDCRDRESPKSRKTLEVIP